jgi:hypothetical protein
MVDRVIYTYGRASMVGSRQESWIMSHMNVSAYLPGNASRFMNHLKEWHFRLFTP